MKQKFIVNTFITIVLFLIFVDALPDNSLAHRRLKSAIDPLLDLTGLWQESWRLFAPEPDKVNVAITAKITYADRSTHSWRSPEWSEMSVLERFLAFREMEFIDSARMASNSGAWPGFADYLARTVRHPDNPALEPVKVELTRHLAVIPPPTAGLKQPFGTKVDVTEYAVFFTRTYGR